MVTSESPTPRASAAIWRSTVSLPWPISAAAIITVAPSPSSSTRMIALEWGNWLR
jgi:hypothetical protein